MRLIVDSSARTLIAGERRMPCAIGKAGATPASLKREGDGATPCGTWPILAALMRPGRVALPVGMRLPWRWLRPDDGWSDDPADPAYNRPVRHPHGRSAERLWRDDGLYDIVVVLRYNDRPPVPGHGSAIFLHCWRGGAATEGCVAVEHEALAALLPLIAPGDVLLIR